MASELPANLRPLPVTISPKVRGRMHYLHFTQASKKEQRNIRLRTISHLNTFSCLSMHNLLLALHISTTNRLETGKTGPTF